LRKKSKIVVMMYAITIKAPGLTVSIIGTPMQSAVSGNANRKFRQGYYEYDIYLQPATAKIWGSI
jgi:multidrug efflux pump subunit AcrB